MIPARAEIAAAMADMDAEALDVATEHCRYLMRQCVTTADAMHMIGAGNRGRGWSYAITRYAKCWKAMQRRRMLEGLQ